MSLHQHAIRVVVFAMMVHASIGLADSTITLHPQEIVRSTLPFQSGVCLEDVNHEIYGGLYSQMIFGEHFAEPAAGATIRGFHSFGGDWTTQDQTLEINGDDGPKLISERAPFTDGTVNVRMQFPNRDGENAGILLRVRRPEVGADAFDGYEISLDPTRQIMRLARHHHDYKVIKDVPCQVPVGQWLDLKATVQGSRIEVFVNGQSVLDYDDGTAALSAGTFGMRAWHSRAMFRNLTVEEGGKSESIAFDQPKSLGEVSTMWQPVIRGAAVGSFTLDKQNPFDGLQSQRITFSSGEGEVGIENRGLNRWGMNFVVGQPYEGCAWVRTEVEAKMTAALENANGSVGYAEQSIDVAAGEWKRVDFTLTPNAADQRGRFAIKLKSPGSIDVGYVFLQPGAWGRFADLPVRGDVVQGLIDQGVSIIRYGGSMVNSPNYRWKNMIGPRDHRPGYSGTWCKYSSNGWGVVDFLNLCEAMKITGIPDLNANESPTDLADFIEYVNGTVESEWGERRAADGHPEPYHLTHLELGNEERVDAAFANKFNALAEAIWAKDPQVILIAGDFGYSRKITDPDHITHADGGMTNLDGQRQILSFAKAHNREVWFDVHVWSERLQPSDNLITLPSYIDAIDKLADGAKHRVVVFELNANSHGIARALANAMSINTIRRDNRIPVVISANGLQPDRQNDNGWDQGLLFLNPSQVWLQSPGYVTQMQARSAEPNVIGAEVKASDTAHLDVTATQREDRKTIILQVVNLGDAESASIDLGGFVPGSPSARITELAGPLNEVNTAGKPAAIVPREMLTEITAGKVTHVFPAHSFTILRFE